MSDLPRVSKLCHDRVQQAVAVMTTPLPRVHEILNATGLGPDFSGVPAATLEAALWRGTQAHAAIEASFYGYLDESALDPDVAPRLEAYRRFVKESGYETVLTEFEVIHPAWRYCGHPDTLGWLGRTRMILDWKAIDSVQLAPASRQLCGYRLAWNAQHPCAPVDALGIVQLQGDGTYRFHEVDSAAHEPVWLAACVVFHAKEEHER